MPQPTVSKILEMKTTLRERMPTTSKTNHIVADDSIDETLAMWINDCASRKVVVSDPLIKKTKRLVLSLNNFLSPDNHLKLSFSNSWVYKFQKVHGFRRIVFRGECNSAAIDSLKIPLPEIREKLSSLAPEDIYHADELGFNIFWPRIAPLQPRSWAGPKSTIQESLFSPAVTQMGQTSSQWE